VPERGCLRIREKLNDFVQVRVANRVRKNDRLWHTVPAGKHRRPPALVSQDECDNPTRILTVGVYGRFWVITKANQPRLRE
jgi:hypothetical protein